MPITVPHPGLGHLAPGSNKELAVTANAASGFFWGYFAATSMGRCSGMLRLGGFLLDPLGLGLVT